jgi:hypothetical protein
MRNDIPMPRTNSDDRGFAFLDICMRQIGTQVWAGGLDGVELRVIGSRGGQSKQDERLVSAITGTERQKISRMSQDVSEGGNPEQFGDFGQYRVRLRVHNRAHEPNIFQRVKWRHVCCVAFHNRLLQHYHSRRITTCGCRSLFATAWQRLPDQTCK